ncbi:MAG TPA: hypothetical protein VFJ62_10835 [Usitatibacter sp.]|nr:hypothetical protein [Usitatibacter sp.]
MRLARIVMWFALLFAAFAACASELTRGLGFDELERSLHLRPAQKEQYDNAVAATQRALLAVTLQGMQLKERAAEELAKPRPDFEALARSQEYLIDDVRPLFGEAREEWLRLYAMLDANQAGIAKSFVQERLGTLLR